MRFPSETPNKWNRLTSLAHLLRVLIGPALYHLDNVLMLPSLDPSFVALGAAVLDGTMPAGLGRVAVHDQAFFLARVGVGKPSAGRANVNILLCDVAEVLLAEAPSAFEFEVIGLGRVTVMPASSQASISPPLK